MGMLSFGAVWMPSSTSSAEIHGIASVVDGDTIEIHGQRIRLFGIDAPESSQLCTDAAGKRWRCGQRAALALSNFISLSHLSCIEKDRDRYRRIVAVCLKGKQDINAWLVANGWALAYREYSAAYVKEEALAKRLSVGIWAGSFVEPWAWRRGARLASKKGSRNQSFQTTQEQGRCVIKGNISRGGERIYHLPGGQYYSRTRIDAAKGERWFCSEEEAQASGWRRSKR
ncbi:MAG: thermonuclease family protein [Alphaproteobacteria bacterium]|nr:thermonuclease family protein [Alphaproteobacteria bacterium]